MTLVATSGRTALLIACPSRATMALAAFEPHMGSEGAFFERTMHMRLLRRRALEDLHEAAASTPDPTQGVHLADTEGG